MISSTKTGVPAWRLPRAGTCGVPEADTFFSAFDDMCEVLEQFADEMPAGYRTQIESACEDFVAMNEKGAISPFCVLDFKCHIDWIIERELDDVTEEEKLAAAAAHLKETTLGTIFNTFGVYTRKRLADVLSKRDGIPITEAEARIRKWEEAGQIRRVDYWGILNAWDGSDYFYFIEEREDRVVCDAVCQVWRSAVHAGLIRNNQTEPNDGLVM